MAKYRHIGKATERKDAKEIVTGAAQYVDDMAVNLENVLIGKLLMSPYPHAKIISIDTSAAEALPGVKAIITYKNAPDWKLGTFQPYKQFMDNKVRFVGDHVALVAAETEEIAEAALDLIKVEYEQLKPVYDVEEAIKPGAVPLYDQYPDNIAPPGCGIYGPTSLDITGVVIGDVTTGFSQADATVEGTYTYEGYPHPMPMEPPSFAAKWEPPNHVSMISIGQGGVLKTVLEGIIGSDQEIEMLFPHIGGSFGEKGGAIGAYYPIALAQKVPGRWVKVIYTKEEHMAIYPLRFGSRIKAKIGLKNDGTVTAFDGLWLTNTLSHNDSTNAEMSIGMGEAQLALRCKNWNLQGKIIFTNRPGNTGPIRGFGGQELKAAFLGLLSIGMEKVSIDPLSFYKKNFSKPGDGYYWGWDGMQKWEVNEGTDYEPVMQAAGDKFGYQDKWKGWLKPTSAIGTKRRGIGVGIHGNADSGEHWSESYVRLEGNGRVVVHDCYTEFGCGQRNSLTKMAAEVLNTSLDNVSMSNCTTKDNPFEFGGGGSRGTATAGTSVTRAALDAKQKLFEMAAPVFQAKPEDMATEDGMLFTKANPGFRLPWIAVLGVYTVTGFGRWDPRYTTPNFMIVFTEVEVDVETGKVDLVDVLVGSDVGQIISPVDLHMQFDGNLGAAGTDTAIFEETIMDQPTGRMLNPNMIDYKWRTYSELPIMQHEIMETPMKALIWGAVGCGEIVTSPGPIAALMAVSNATGQRFYDYPISPAKILKALGKI